jgi:hypothetical protein
MAKIEVAELDCFYISYDEPNAEENWADCLNKIPWADRVHGYKGFDNAHKECARRSTTDRFITIDGDNIVMPEFFEQTLDVPDKDHEGRDLSECIFSWNAKNLLNGLVYGNGGLKCWPKQYALDMKTHEEADDGEEMEFCWKLNYIQLNDIYSEVHQTATPFQAFRAGFREGVKMSMDQGKYVKPEDFKEKIWWQNFNRLQVWCNVGNDVENGLWAMYAARLGCKMAVLDKWDPNQINDYEWFKKFFEEEVSPQFQLGDGTGWQHDTLELETQHLGELLNQEIHGMCLIAPDVKTSEFFKLTYVNPKRWGVMIREKQIQDLLEEQLK